MEDVAAEEPAELSRWRVGAGRWLTDPSALAETQQPAHRRRLVVAVATTAVVRPRIIHTLHADLSAFWRIDLELTAGVEVALSPQCPGLRWVAAPARTACDQGTPR